MNERLIWYLVLNTLLDLFFTVDLAVKLFRSSSRISSANKLGWVLLSFLSGLIF